MRKIIVLSFIALFKVAACQPSNTVTQVIPTLTSTGHTILLHDDERHNPKPYKLFWEAFEKGFSPDLTDLTEGLIFMAPTSINSVTIGEETLREFEKQNVSMYIHFGIAPEGTPL